MPDITNQDTAKDIARYYCTNGRNKSQALIDAGYSVSYAKTSRGLSIYRKKEVIDAINDYEHKIEANTAYTVKSAEKELDEALELARSSGNPNAMVSAITGKCKLYGLMVDKVQTEDITAPVMSDEELQAITELARERNIQISKVS